MSVIKCFSKIHFLPNMHLHMYVYASLWPTSSIASLIIYYSLPLIVRQLFRHTCSSMVPSPIINSWTFTYTFFKIIRSYCVTTKEQCTWCFSVLSLPNNPFMQADRISITRHYVLWNIITMSRTGSSTDGATDTMWSGLPSNKRYRLFIKYCVFFQEL